MNLIPGAEPFFYPGGEVGCLLIHGYTSTPQELREMGERLASRGFSALGVRLQGHGTDPRQLARSGWRDWSRSVSEGYARLQESCRTIVPIGLSMGGALALMTAAEQEVAGVVAMSTPFEIPPQPKLRMLRPLIPLLAPLSRVFPYLPKPPRLDYRDKEAARNKVSYSVYPTRSLAEVARLLARVRRMLPRIQVPVLLMHSQGDLGVSPRNAEAIFARLATSDKELVWVQDSGHTMTLEPAKERVFKAAGDFAARVAQGSDGRVRL